MGMASANPSLLPMLRLWAIVLMCLFTYIHATATLGTDGPEKLAKTLNVMDRHGLLSLWNGPSESLLTNRSEMSGLSKKSAAQAQAQQAAC